MMFANPLTMTQLAIAATASPAAIWSVAHARSAAVRNWAASSLPIGRYGPLLARAGGEGDDAVLLLHGLISTGDVFGAAYDPLVSSRRLVVPDLLGFGRSMDEQRNDFPIDAHLDALDVLAARSGLYDSVRWTIGAHSMGSALALRWAARHRDRVVRVVSWGAPLYPDPEAARSRVAGSAMARLFALDTNLAARACGLSCRHRTAAGWLSATLEPGLPVRVARAAPLHTWPAYRDAIRHLVIDTNWVELIMECDQVGIEVRLVWGSRDRIGDDEHAAEIVSRSQLATVVSVRGTDHRLPMAHPELCIEHLVNASTNGRSPRTVI